MSLYRPCSLMSHTQDATTPVMQFQDIRSGKDQTDPLTFKLTGLNFIYASDLIRQLANQRYVLTYTNNYITARVRPWKLLQET